jgi:hypothetical protein
MTNEQEAKRAREIQRVTNAYHRVFKSEDGQMVLQNLKAYFRMDRPAFDRPPLTHTYDPISGAIRDGQREIVLWIEHKLTLPVVADSDAEPKNAVIVKD